MADAPESQYRLVHNDRFGSMLSKKSDFPTAEASG
jgi:hypothetical protein